MDSSILAHVYVCCSLKSRTYLIFVLRLSKYIFKYLSESGWVKERVTPTEGFMLLADRVFKLGIRTVSLCKRARGYSYHLELRLEKS